MGVSLTKGGNVSMTKQAPGLTAVDLQSLAGDVDKVVFPVSIYDAGTRGQSFGQVRNAFIRVVNQ